MIKEYLTQEYRKSILDFKLSKNETEQWNARAALAKIEQIASEKYGFEYQKNLHEILEREMKNYGN